MGWEDFAGHSLNTKTYELDIKSEYIKDVEHIYIAGGEPLYMKQMYNFIDSLENKENIGLFINTNLTVINKETFFDRFKDFKIVHLHISCDGRGDVGEFVRTNKKWSIFEENLKFVKELRERDDINLKYNIQSTVSVLNCFHLFELRYWMMNEGYIYGDIDFTFNWVDFPFWYDVKSYPMFKEHILDIYKMERDKIEEEITNPLNEEETIKNPFYVDITNFIVNLESNHKPNPKSRVMLEANINHGLKYNNTKLPKDLRYINDIIDGKWEKQI